MADGDGARKANMKCDRLLAEAAETTKDKQQKAKIVGMMEEVGVAPAKLDSLLEAAHKRLHMGRTENEVRGTQLELAWRRAVATAELRR